MLNTEQFLRVWEIFAAPPGNSTIIFCPGAGNLTQKIGLVAGISSLKKFSPGLPGGGGGFTQLELTET